MGPIVACRMRRVYRPEGEFGGDRNVDVLHGAWKSVVAQTNLTWILRALLKASYKVPLA